MYGKLYCSGNCFYYTPGKVLIIRVVIFVWWGETTAGRGEWRYISMENGGLLLMTVLIEWMLMWSANNLVNTM